MHQKYIHVISKPVHILQNKLQTWLNIWEFIPERNHFCATAALLELTLSTHWNVIRDYTLQIDPINVQNAATVVIVYPIWRNTCTQGIKPMKSQHHTDLVYFKFRIWRNGEAYDKNILSSGIWVIRYCRTSKSIRVINTKVMYIRWAIWKAQNSKW